ncbi:MAG: restriction endonuclease, partial [Anaerovoracaceae bacterium]
EYNEIVDSFYNYFEDGYNFEEFLKVYLEKIGLEEVFVTKKSGDGGIDLTAVRKGIGGLSNSVDESFYIQAKRYSPASTISPEKIRALRGSFRSGVGMFITTGKVSDNAKVEAQQIDPSRPIIVVDGRELVNTCIEKEIGFTFKPVFSKPALDNIMKNTSAVNSEQGITVDRVVTENDIRAYILVLPRAIKERLSENVTVITIRFGNSSYKEYRIDAQRRYVGGISKAYRDFGLRQPDGVFISKRAVWHIESGGRFTVEFEEI